MRQRAPSPKTKIGAWLTPEGQPIAMRNCELLRINPTTKIETKQRCIFFSDNGDSQHAAFTQTFHDTKDPKNTGGFSENPAAPQTEKYDSIYHYITTIKPASKDINRTLWSALWKKYTQNDQLRADLLATKEAFLIEDTLHGIGTDGKKENLYGRMLMRMRTALQNCEETRATQQPPTKKWVDEKQPSCPTDDALQADLDSIYTAAKENTIDNFTRLETTLFNKMSPQKKQTYIEEVVQAVKMALSTSNQPGFCDKIAFDLVKTKKKSAQGLEEELPSITINGDKISIEFEATVGRKSMNEGLKKTPLKLDQTLHADGTSSFAVTQKTDTFEERKHIFKLMAATAAKIQTGGLEKTQVVNEKLLLTGAEEAQLKQATFTNLEVPDTRGVVGKHTVEVYGTKLDLDGVTPKQAAAIAGFLEHFNEINFKRNDGTVLSLTAPIHAHHAMSTTQGVLPSVVQPQNRSRSSSTASTGSSDNNNDDDSRPPSPAIKN
ncbi:MAG: hypothetical protein Q8L78_07305 [Coxiellaceae bacterium]|nr:hypothetical protein [Coxiellaceae bacterium]